MNRHVLTLLCVSVLLAAGGCSDPVDGGPSDGGSEDAQVRDSGALDGAARDSGALDGGALDGGALDGAARDSGALDGAALDSGADAAAEEDAGEPDGSAHEDGSVTDAGTPCGADELVLDHACVACGSGATNVAGDDPAGDDTFCDDACTPAIGVDCDTFREAYLKASNTGWGDEFGNAIAISGDTLAVGAPSEAGGASGVGADETSDSASDAGAVYVFRRASGVWSQEAYIKASAVDPQDFFGHTLTLEGDTLVVGAAYEDSGAVGVGGNDADNSRSGAGAAYVFTRTGGVWTQQAYLKASNTWVGDHFGALVALSGDTLAISATGEGSAATGVGGNQSDNSAPGAGAIYVFSRAGGTWSQQAYIKASNTGADDGFGTALALEGDTLAVAAVGEDSNATGVGGDQSDNSATSAGAAYVFTRTGGVWTQQAYLKASNTDQGDRFGYVLALSGNTLAVGAPGERSSATGVGGLQSDNSITLAGAVYVFVRAGAIWSQHAYLKASNTGANDLFGFALALEGDTLAVGAYRESGGSTGVDGDELDNSANASGAVYLFRRSVDVWSQHAYLKASNTGEGDGFGRRLALEAGTLAIGAPNESSSATGVDGDEADDLTPLAGAVYVRRIAP